MKKQFDRHRGQKGVVLAVVLVMVPVIFMLSFTSINKLTVGERATTNVVDRGHAFYAAEMAIADAETWMRSGKEPFVDGFTEEKFNQSGVVHKGFYPINADVDINSVLSDSNNQGVFGYGYYKNKIDDPPIVVEGLPLQGEPPADEKSIDILSTLSDPPAYIIQLIDIASCPVGSTHYPARFKVSARGWGVQSNTMVTLETFFSLNFVCKGIQNGNEL